ncbi:unnamed protein product [Owenia fusiformis]|uniref:Uncharacterized protein n=1 Tax=Owenia fusiformis TaxID=6347 RepID=A0A8J1URL5_OWEFU|nr:unnamed protein product [Owenia fusiformis]
MAKRNIAYIKQDEPSFLQQMKQRMGYKEGPTVNTKYQQQDDVDSDPEREDNEDEAPTIVVLKPGDLSATDVEKIKGGAVEDKIEGVDRLQGDDSAPEGGKIMFRKPVKRSTDENNDLNVSSKKKKDSSKLKDKQSKVKSVKNTKLLSFGDEEEEEDG